MAKVGGWRNIMNEGGSAAFFEDRIRGMENP
jgi:hypothetical protein